MGFLTRMLHLKAREKPLKKVIADFGSDDLQDAIEMLNGLGYNSRDKLFISVVVLTCERVDFKDVQIKGDPNVAATALCRLRPGELTGWWPKAVKTYRRVDDALGVLFDLMCFQHMLLHINYDEQEKKTITLYVI